MVALNKRFVIFYMIFVLSTDSISCFSLGDIICRLFNWCVDQETYKLTYFDIRGRAEFIRFMFAATNRVYEDNRITAVGWPGIKSVMPFEQLPVLEIDRGNQKILLAQSQAIAKYLGKKFNIGGRSDIETALIDMYGEQISDLFNEFASLTDASDHARFNETWSRNLNYFEKRIVENKSGFLVGSSLSWADIYLAQMVEFMDIRQDEILSYFPYVRRLTTKVRDIPLIADWIRRRPSTEG